MPPASRSCEWSPSRGTPPSRFGAPRSSMSAFARSSATPTRRSAKPGLDELKLEALTQFAPRRRSDHPEEVSAVYEQSSRRSSARPSPRRTSVRTDAARRTSASSRSRSASCHARTARPSSPAARPRSSRSRRSARRGDEQIIDTLSPVDTKRYMHHYNFPPYSVGEVRMMRGAGRREIGHGALAERALMPVIPTKEEFPYTIRVVSRDARVERLVLDGLDVCGSTLALMDAGVPIKATVAGIAMGLVTARTASTRSSPTSRASRTTTATWTSRSAAPPRA